MDIKKLLKRTVEDEASDLHLTVGAKPTVRLHGEMMALEDQQKLTAETMHEILMPMLNDAQRETFTTRRDIDFSVEVPGLARFRANFYVGRLGEGAVFRVIPTRIKTFDELRLPRVVKQLARCEKGLVLVTGTTGSGKSTTLAAMLDLINSERQAHILTVEDPIEFVHEHKKCLVNQREVGGHTDSFATALKAALREDPDVILVGEMRDLETISLACTAAETGHLVLATLHTSSAAQTMDRIIDAFPPHQQAQIRTQLSESLQGVVAQSLVPKIGGGRIAAVEIMVSTAAVRNLVRDNKTFQLPSVIETNRALGMQTMSQALADLVKDGVITTEHAVMKGLDREVARTMAVERDPSTIHLDTATPARPRTVEAVTDDDNLDLNPLFHANRR